MTRRRVLLTLLLVVAGVAARLWWTLRPAPGESFQGEPPPITVPQLSLAQRLRRDVTALAALGERSAYRPAALAAAADLVAERMTAAGLVPRRFVARDETLTADVVWGAIEGRASPDEWVVVGAHHDTLIGSPGANAYASGVALMLSLAEHFAAASGSQRGARTLVFASFPMAAHPYLQTERMASLQWARSLESADVDVAAMLSLDSIGFFTDEPDSQHLPAPAAPLFPSVGNYVGIVGDLTSAALVRHVTGVFREHASVPSESGVGPAPWDGIGWSDHWSFWQCGWPAVAITDTGPFRDPQHGLRGDLPGRLDYETMARIHAALVAVVEDLVEAD